MFSQLLLTDHEWMFFNKKRTTTMLLTTMVTAIFITVSSVCGIYSINEVPKDNVNQTEEFGSTLPEATPMQQPANEHAAGFLPPEMDLSHLTGQNLPKGYRTGAPPSSFDWRPLGKVTPVYPPGQGNCGSCYAFASIGCFESKILVDNEPTFDLSEDNVKECGWYHSCCTGGNFYKVSSFLSQDGTVLESADPYMPFHNTWPPCGSCDFKQTLLDWRIISGDSVPSTVVLKNYIYYEGPAYVSMWCGADPYDASWRDEFSNYDGSYTLYKPWDDGTDHAVLIVGWNDNLTHAGGTGGWIVKNSWGTNWGGTCGFGTEKGYFTIAYGSAAIGKWSSYVDHWGYYDTGGGIMYYDEGGWSESRGYPSGSNPTTAWGLCKFVPESDTKVTRVEFWTTDKTTDVDVYIYDDFNGNELWNLLWSSLNHDFTEAGYHGVQVDPSLQVTGGNAVTAVVKFTNSNYKYPVPVDKNGPSQISCTYISPDGTTGSWYDLGQIDRDVAIRLRTSYNNLPNKPTIAGPTSGSAGTPYTYTFTSTDPDGNQVSYYVDWGDGTRATWSAFQASGTPYSPTHTWSAQGTYTIKAQAKDWYGYESPWATLTVSMPRNKVINRPLFSFLENHPNLFPILQQLLQRLGL